jgi:23S rRNA (guanosine2251-2'-O)-methyltransferase
LEEPVDPSQPRRRILGIQPVREAIAVHGAALRVLVEARRDAAPQLEAVARFARDRGAKVERVDRGTLDRLGHGERHQGVIAEAPPLSILRQDEIATAVDGRPPLLVALDEITDPQNFGAVVRSEVALGATGIVWPEDRSAPLSAAMVRASAGAVEHARLCRVGNLTRALEGFAERGLSVVGLDASSEIELSTLPLDGPLCLVIGAEGSGLRRSTKRACGSLARLRMRGPIASLNASVAAALAVYEALRARG